MSLSELYFQKEIYDLKIEDLKAFFSEEQEESSRLEFKTGQVGIEHIYKEVCAFLNTEGGLLIIGTPKETKTKLPNGSEITTCKGELIPSNYKNRDWLIQKIVGNISPQPHGIMIQDIFDDKGSYFVIDVQQSITPPHQSNDGTYYIRLERDSKPAPHGLVEALFFKRQKPKLEVNTNIYFTKQNTHEVSFSIKNNSSYPTEKVSFSVYFKNIDKLTEIGSNNSPSIKDSEDSLIINYTSEMVLWKGLEIKSNYQIHHRSEPFLINVTCWSRDAELVKSIGVYDPLTNTLIESENDTSENKKGFEHYFKLLESLISIGT